MGYIVVRYRPYLIRVPTVRQDAVGPGRVAVQVDGFGPGVVEIKPQIVAQPLAYRPLHGVIVPTAVGGIGVVSGNLLVEQGKGSKTAARWGAIDVDVIGDSARVHIVGPEHVVNALRRRQPISSGARPHILPIRD